MLIAGSPQTPALGAAIVGGGDGRRGARAATRLGRGAGAHDVAEGEAVRAATRTARAVYDELYGIYRELHDAFGGVAGATADLGDVDEAAARRFASARMETRSSGYGVMSVCARRRLPRQPASWPTSGLVLGTFGNVSAVDREAGVFVIKPSGVPYDDADAGAHGAGLARDAAQVVDGTLRPSSDTPTHLELYRAFPSSAAIVHTHSEYATVVRAGAARRSAAWGRRTRTTSAATCR